MYRRLLLLLLLLLFLGTLMPGSVKATIEGKMWHVLPWSGLAHAVLFAAIASLPVYGHGRPMLWRPMLFALFLAGLTEALQTWVPGRHPLLRDVGIDMAGALVGLELRVVQDGILAKRPGA